MIESEEQLVQFQWRIVLFDYNNQMLQLRKKNSEQRPSGEQEGNPQLLPVRPKRTMATLRLQKDLLALDQLALRNIRLEFPDENSIQLIRVVISPQITSPYHHTSIRFELSFPNDYPMSPPKVRCLQRIYHPNINTKGTVCLPLVREDYGPTVTLANIICGLLLILTVPEADDALNPSIGDIMASDTTFRRIVSYTVRGQSYHGEPYDKVWIGGDHRE